MLLLEETVRSIHIWVIHNIIFYISGMRARVLRFDLSHLLSDSSSVQLSHDGLASFVLPGSLLVAAKNKGHSECMFVNKEINSVINIFHAAIVVSYLFNGLERILSTRPSKKSVNQCINMSRVTLYYAGYTKWDHL